MSDSELTLWCGNLSSRITEELLYELFLQAGPLKKVALPKDSAGNPRPFAFITFDHECSVSYAAALFEGTKLFGRPLLLRHKSMPIESYKLIQASSHEEFKRKQPTSWAELNLNKGDNSNRNDHNIAAVGIGLGHEPNFIVPLEMDMQMMLPPQNFPTKRMNFPPYFGGPVQYPSQMEDQYGGSFMDTQHYGHKIHPYEGEQDYREGSHKEIYVKDHGRPHYRNRERSISHRYHHERRYQYH